MKFKFMQAIDIVRVILNKIHISLFTASLRRLLPSFILAFDLFGVLFIVKNKLTSLSYVSDLLLMINFVITLSKWLRLVVPHPF